MSSPRLLLVAAAAATMTTLAACGWVIGLEQPVAIERPPPSAPPAEAAARPGCAHAQPAPMNGDDDPATEVAPFWLALDEFRYDHVVDGAVAGFDLDETCTCGDDDHDGAAPCVTSVPGGRVCDADGGVDNELGAMLARFSSAYDLSAYGGKEIARGRRTLLLWIKGYNGLANDADVTVALVLSDGLYTNLGCDDRPRGAARDGGCPPSTDDARCIDGGVFPPTWDGCDRWKPTAGSATFSAGRTRAVGFPTDHAYVVNQQLVVRHAGPLQIVAPGNVISLTNAITVGHLIPRGGSSSFDLAGGRIAGRAPIVDIARAIGGAPTDGFGGRPEEPFCESDFWDPLRLAVCQSADMTTGPALDFSGARCDAFGFAIGFSARLAEVDDRGVTPLFDKPTPCKIPDSVEAFCGAADGGVP